MLTVAAGAEARFEKTVSRQISGVSAGLEVAEVTEMLFVGMHGVGVIEARQRIAIVAVDTPIDVGIRHPPVNARAGENFHMIVEVALGGCGPRKGAVRN